MDMDREWGRLRQLYDEKSNEELVALWGNRDSLTQIAQEALRQLWLSCRKSAKRL
jgi:hypothetical protein